MNPGRYLVRTFGEDGELLSEQVAYVGADVEITVPAGNGNVTVTFEPLPSITSGD